MLIALTTKKDSSDAASTKAAPDSAATMQTSNTGHGVVRSSTGVSQLVANTTKEGSTGSIGGNDVSQTSNYSRSFMPTLHDQRTKIYSGMKNPQLQHLLN